MEGNLPTRCKPRNLAGYLEALSRLVFQAGASWRAVDAKWDGIREAFSEFDPQLVADYGQRDVEQLLGDPRVVRSRARIEATVDNAQALIELDAEYAGFERYLSSHPTFEDTVSDLKRQFRFIGDSGAYHFLWSVNEPTPPHEELFSARERANGARRRSSQRTKRKELPHAGKR